jgi:hypothetical protein
MRIINSVAATTIVLFLATGTAKAATTTYPALQSTVKYTKTATGAQYYGNYARATSKVLYDPVTQTYTLRDTGNTTLTSSFGPNNVNAAKSDSRFAVYEKNGGTETFRLLKLSPTNPLIVLSYVDYGQWRRTTASGTTTNVNDTYVVFGQKTASVPTSGDGTYSTVLDGTFVNSKGAYAVSGTGTLTAHFGSGSIDYWAAAAGTPEGSGTAINFGTMTGAGSIAYGGFKGTGTTNGSGYALDVTGNFYGPAAEEIGGLFRIRGGNGNGQGAIVGN